jgi:hypothetical protein
MGHVRELVTLRALNDAIKNENIAICFRFKDEDVLVDRFLDVEDFVYLEGHGLTGPL